MLYKLKKYTVKLMFHSISCSNYYASWSNQAKHNNKSAFLKIFEFFKTYFFIILNNFDMLISKIKFKN